MQALQTDFTRHAKMSQKKQFTILLSKSEKVFEVSAKKYSFLDVSQRTIVEGFYKPDDLWQTINPFDYPQHDAKSPAVVPRMGCKSLSAASKTLCIHHSSCLFPSNWQHWSWLVRQCWHAASATLGLAQNTEGEWLSNRAAGQLMGRMEFEYYLPHPWGLPELINLIHHFIETAT